MSDGELKVLALNSKFSQSSRFTYVYVLIVPEINIYISLVYKKQSTLIPGHPTSTFGIYLFGRRFEI